MRPSYNVSSRILGHLARRHRCFARARLSSSIAASNAIENARNDHSKSSYGDEEDDSTFHPQLPWVTEASEQFPEEGTTSTQESPSASDVQDSPHSNISSDSLSESRSALFASLLPKAPHIRREDSSSESAYEVDEFADMLSLPVSKDMPTRDVTAAIEEATAKPSLSLSARLLERIALEEAGTGTEKSTVADLLKQIRDSQETKPHNPRPQRRLPWYKRRVEGFISHADKPVWTDLVPASGKQPIAKLHHGLTRVLFNSGVYWLQDPRSQVYNFHPKLKKIPQVDDFAFDRVIGFVPSSGDEDLWQLAKKEGCQFTGSTSSLTGVLSQIYFLLSNEKLVDLRNLSSAFRREPRTFTPGQRMPVSVTLKYRDGVYSTDSDVSHLDVVKETVLTKLGVVMEKIFTLSWDKVNNLMRNAPSAKATVPPRTQAYRYAKCGKFVMRSQLDCQNPSLPGTGVFDIKTRAAMPIRLDVWNYEDHVDYRIKSVHGTSESFEKEYYDLVRSAFLKYSFQARIGNMDGVFVAYHNTQEVFGFQYIPLEEMDTRLYGNAKSGPRVFDKCVGIMEAIFTEISTYFPEQSVRCTFETRDFGDNLRLWIEPETWLLQDEKLVVQLNIKVWNYLGAERVPSAKAVEAVDDDWHVSYSITKSPLPLATIVANRQAAYDRQLSMYRFGLDINDVVEHGDGLTQETLKKASEARAVLFESVSQRKAGAATGIPGKQMDFRMSKALGEIVAGKPQDYAPQQSAG